MHITAADIEQTASKAAFGKPLIVNVYRSLIVEAIVSRSLNSEWTWCSHDYSSHDFIHRDLTRLEVKQSAVRQTWSSNGPSSIRWDIAPRTGRWDGAVWVAEPGRNAEIYIFAMHCLYEDADHRDPSQWQFFVCEALKLPNTKTLSLSSINALGFSPIKISDLSFKVDQIRLNKS